MDAPALSFKKDPSHHPNFHHSSGFLHSVKDPDAEAERIVSSLNFTSRAPLLVVGIGWGYLAQAVQRRGIRDAFFFEPSLDVVQSLEGTGRLSELRALGLTIVTSDAELREAAEARWSVQLFVTPAYRRLFPDLESRVTRVISGEDNSVQASTTRRFFRLWMRHSLARIRQAEPLPFVGGLTLGGRTVVFCGASPNLTVHLESFLKSGAREAAVIVCSDTALAPVLSLGVQPDLVLSVDAGAGTAYHCAAAEQLSEQMRGRQSLSSIPCLSWTGGSPALSAFFKSVLYYRTTFPLDQLYALGGPLSDIPEWTNPTMNVAGLALWVASQGGGKHVLLLGTDLVSQGGVTHTRGTGYSYYAVAGTSRVWRPEMYAPRGYGPELTQKNRAAAEGLKELGRKLGVRVFRMGSDWAEAESLFKVQPTEPFQIQTTSVETGRLAESLQKMRGKIDYETLARQTGSGRTDVERWQTWIQSV
ncbi:MAG: DUF115 domain-containing protein [Spirochaetia bacterium]|nr:DUF115 domain-containing protein [Spirochaetia bacterium]